MNPCHADFIHETRKWIFLCYFLKLRSYGASSQTPLSWKTRRQSIQIQSISLVLMAWWQNSDYLHKLVEVLKELLLVDGELVIFVDDVIMFHLRLRTDTQRIVTREVVTLTYEEQSVFTGLQQLLCLLTLEFAVKPAATWWAKQCRNRAVN